MRLTSIAAGIITLALGAYPALTTIQSRAAAAPRNGLQGTPRGPMSSPSSSPTSEAPPSIQQDAPVPQQRLSVQTTIVNVFATVRDRHNGIVGDLTKDDFKIYEDGVEQKLAYFTKEVDMPLSFGLLMDTSGSMHFILDAEQDAASTFVHEVMRKKDEAIVLSFDTDVNLLADFTEDPQVLRRAIRRAQINVDASGIGGTGGTTRQTGSGAKGNHYNDGRRRHRQQIERGRCHRSGTARRRRCAHRPHLGPTGDRGIRSGSRRENSAGDWRSRHQRSEREGSRKSVRYHFRRIEIG